MKHEAKLPPALSVMMRDHAHCKPREHTSLIRTVTYVVSRKLLWISLLSQAETAQKGDSYIYEINRKQQKTPSYKHADDIKSLRFKITNAEGTTDIPRLIFPKERRERETT